MMRLEANRAAMRAAFPRATSLAGALLCLGLTAGVEAREIAVSCPGTVTTDMKNSYTVIPTTPVASTATFFIDTDHKTVDYQIEQLVLKREKGAAVELASGQLLMCRQICGAQSFQGSDRQGSYSDERDWDRIAVDLASGRTTFGTDLVRTYSNGEIVSIKVHFEGRCDVQALAQVANELGGASAVAEATPSQSADTSQHAESSASQADTGSAADAEAAQRAEDERRRAELAAQERRAADEQRAAEARLREAEQREAEMKKRLEEQERRLAELQRKEEEARRKEEEARRPIDFKEGIVLCQMGSNDNAVARCQGPLQTISSAIKRLDDAYTRAQIGMACGSDRNLRDIGMVSGMRAFGCGFGIHPDPAMASYPGNIDVPARMAVYVADRGVFRCPRSTEAYCTGR
jgi:hypothetical protein